MQRTAQVAGAKARNRVESGDRAVAALHRSSLATLPPGDPLRYLLHLSAEELRGVMKSFPNVLRQNPQLKDLVAAVLESKAMALEGDK